MDLIPTQNLTTSARFRNCEKDASSVRQFVSHSFEYVDALLTPSAPTLALLT